MKGIYPMLDFRIETFITVCETLNFTKAAQQLGITQPAVSQHIRFLEDEYRVLLFEHSGKKIKLTEEGKILQSSAITMKHDEIHLKNQLASRLSQKKKLTFGATLTVGEFIITKHISSYLESHPNTQIKMMVANTNELLEKLDSGEIDFAIVEGYFTKSEYDHQIYSKEKYIAVCSGNHLFTKSPRAGTREILTRALEGMNYSITDFANQIEINNMNVIKYLTAQDCGITFLYEAAVKNELESGILKEIALSDLNILHDITFIWRKGSIFKDYYIDLFYTMCK